MTALSIAALRPRDPQDAGSRTLHGSRTPHRRRAAAHTWAGGEGQGARTAPLCSLTIDVEDWYQSSVDFDAPITDRVVRNMARVMTVLDEEWAEILRRHGLGE